MEVSLNLFEKISYWLKIPTAIEWGLIAALIAVFLIALVTAVGS